MFMCQHKSKKKLKNVKYFKCIFKKDPKYFESLIEYV